MKTKTITSAVSSALFLFALAPRTGLAATYAPWLSQIGVSDSVLSAANWGTGQMLGVVDTGIVANNQVFAAGQVSTALSSCAAVTFNCSNGFVDDNSHGTAVASIAAANRPSPYSFGTGGYSITAGSLIGVAPNANILAEKVLNASGAGYSTDVASGVKKAADAGASVINVSITYGNTADLVSAINYAAGKGAFIVWAGGNSAQKLLNGASTRGLTAAAISRLVFAGSVSPKNALSTFSNKPGNGAFVDGANSKTSYSARWIMAPGESILAPVVTSGTDAWGSWSGTSMSAPLVSGSLMLLQSAWPILKTNGTTANLLLATATDLGAKGVDSTYGNGLVSLVTAFQPYGALSVTQANGKTTPVSSLSGSMLSSGALGSLSAVQSKLANYTSFDSYARNFSVNLSGLIKSPSSTATTNPLPVNTNSGPIVMKLVGGSELAFMQAPVANAADRLGLFGAAEAMPDKRIGYAMLTDKAGTTTALGYGFPVQFSYARALYGNDDIARLSGELGVSNLAGLAQGGGLFAYGTKLTDYTRIAFSLSGTASIPDSVAALQGPAWSGAKASNFGVGLTHNFNEQVAGGINLGALDETHGMLGSTYDTGSAVSLGESNKTYSLGLSMGVLFDRNNTLLVETGFASTKGASANGLIAGTTDIQSRSYGMTFMSKNLFETEDRLTASIKQPLRVASGQAALVTPSIDEQGIATFNREMVSLAPNGREIDYQLSYAMPLSASQSLSLQAGMRNDVLNIQGDRDSSVGMAWVMKF